MTSLCPDCSTPLVDDADGSSARCPECGRTVELDGETETLTYHPQPAADETGATQVAHFDLLERIGQGTFGAVWKARDRRLDRIVALKLPRLADVDSHSVDEFLHEARALAKLRHASIVEVYEADRVGESVYIASRFVDGESLDAWRRRVSPSFRESVQVCLMLAAALHHAHEAGIVHRDLKPGNIIIAADGAPVVLDFGLAKRMDGDAGATVAGEIKGTPAYMAPEQAEGRADIADRRADVYSQGVVLFELLTGERPFRGTGPRLLQQVIVDEPPRPTSLDARVPRDLETICLKCLEKSPDRRFATAAQLHDELQRWLEGKPIQSRPISRWERAWRWVRRHPGRATIAALSLAVLVLVGFAIGLYLQREAVAGQRDRAVVAERDKQRALALETAESARLKMSRGRFGEALALLDEAIAQKHPDPVALRMLKVDAFNARGDLAAAGRELGVLQKQADLGKHAGAVALRRADYALRMGRRTEAIAGFHEASKHELPAADAAYVRGMLAETSEAALAQFQKAVQANPFDHRAAGSEALMLIALGRVDEAALRVEAATKLFPEMRQIPRLQAFLLALHGKLPQARRLIASAVEAERRESFGEILDILAKAGREPLLMKLGPQANLQGDANKLRDLFLKHQGVAVLRSGIGFPPVIAQKLERYPARIFSGIMTPRFADAATAVEEVLTVHPEGTLTLLRGTLVLASGRINESIPIFAKAAEMPAIHPQTHNEALFGVAMFATQAGFGFTGIKDESRRGRLLNQAAGAIGRLPDDWVRKAPHVFVPAATKAGNLPLARRVWQIWQKNADPRSAILWQRKMEIEFADGNWLKTVELADRVLTLDARNAKAPKIREQSLRKLNARTLKVHGRAVQAQKPEMQETTR